MTKGGGRPKRQTTSMDMLIMLVNDIESLVVSGRRGTQVFYAFANIRAVERRLTDQQAADPRLAELLRRIQDIETMYRERGNPVVVLQHRITAALERLEREPDSDLKRELLELLTPSPEETSSLTQPDG